MFFDNAVRSGEAQASAHAHGLGSEERIKNLRDLLVGNAGASVADYDDDLIAFESASRWLLCRCRRPPARR